MNKIDQRSIIAIVLCVAFYLVYTQYLNTKYPKPVHAETTASQSSPNSTTSTATTAAAPVAPGVPTGAPIMQLTPAELTVESDLVTYQFSQDLGGLASIKMRAFKSDRGGADQLDILDTPMAIQATADTKTTEPVKGVFHAERQGQTIRFWREAGGLRMTQAFTVPAAGYGAELKVSFTNITDKPIDLTGGLLVVESIRPKKTAAVLGIIPGSTRVRDQLVYNADGSTEWLDIEKFCKNDKDAPHLSGVPIRFAGIDRHYFLSVIEPQAKNGSLNIDHGPANDAGCPLTVLNFDRQGAVNAGETVTLDYATYNGPKDLKILQAQNADLPSAMHLGTFSFIARPLLMVIEGFERFTNNYGVAIILLTICLKMLFFPLVRASAVSMHKMKKLNPQMAALKEKFKDDKAKQQQALMKFMGENKINPMKGCLPVLPQIPVFFAFYQVLQTSISLRHAPFVLWIQDLSAMDPYFVTPLLMGVAMFAQQKLTPTTGMDKTQEKILMLMPIMFTVMMLTLPAGLTLYMLTNTVIGIAQQKWLYRRLDRLEPSMP